MKAALHFLALAILLLIVMVGLQILCMGDKR